MLSALTGHHSILMMMMKTEHLGNNSQCLTAEHTDDWLHQNLIHHSIPVKRKHSKTKTFKLLIEKKNVTDCFQVGLFTCKWGRQDLLKYYFIVEIGDLVDMGGLLELWQTKVLSELECWNRC